MKNMKIAAKLILSFSIVAAITAIVGIVGIVSLKTIDTSYTTAYEVQSRPIPDIAKIIEYNQRMRVQIRNCIIYVNDPQRLSAVATDVNDQISQFESYLAAYDVTIVNPVARQKFDEAKDLYFNSFKPIVVEMVQGAQQGKSTSELTVALDSATEATNKMVDNFTECMNIKVKAASDNSDENTALANRILIIMIAVVIAGIIIAMILGVYIAKIIGEPVKRMRQLMDQIGTTGDLQVKPELKSMLDQDAQCKDEVGESVKACNNLIGHISRAADSLQTIAGGDLTGEIKTLSDKDVLGISLTKTQDSLNHMFADINSSSDQVSTGSVQIADGAQLLAQGATEQSATVEEISASIAQISVQTKENADMANDAKVLGESIKQSAERGSNQMNQMMIAVQEINESSKSIGKVIKIIDDIAFQTNILALNAAVEAARAGQHGKGFAVVADEVRNLAAKSAEAAKNTNELIESSIQKAEQGASISAETSGSLHEIVDGILRTSELIADISKSSNEQSIAISQISEAIDQVTQVVQQNSATAEESAAASEEMSGQATLLRQLISQFKLKAFNSRAHAANTNPPAALGYSPISSSPETGFAMSGNKY